MSTASVPTTIATIGLDLGENTFHLIGLDRRGAIVFQLDRRDCVLRATDSQIRA
jgi:hypothetical protein